MVNIFLHYINNIDKCMGVWDETTSICILHIIIIITIILDSIYMSAKSLCTMKSKMAMRECCWRHVTIYVVVCDLCFGSSSLSLSVGNDLSYLFKKYVWIMSPDRPILMGVLHQNPATTRNVPHFQILDSYCIYRN